MGGRMEGTKELIITDAIRSKVYILRGQQVMLDQIWHKFMVIKLKI